MVLLDKEEINYDIGWLNEEMRRLNFSARHDVVIFLVGIYLCTYIRTSIRVGLIYHVGTTFGLHILCTLNGIYVVASILALISDICWVASLKGRAWNQNCGAEL